MKATASYRPRMVIKRFPDLIDRDEIGIAYDEEKNAFYLCPPDLSSEDPDELERRWAVFLKLVDLIPDFQIDESWLKSFPPKIVDAYARAKQNNGVSVPKPIQRSTIGSMLKRAVLARSSVRQQLALQVVVFVLSVIGLLIPQSNKAFCLGLITSASFGAIMMSYKLSNQPR